MTTSIQTFAIRPDDQLCILARGANFDAEKSRLYEWAGRFVEWMGTTQRRWSEFDVYVMRALNAGRPNPPRLSVSGTSTPRPLRPC